MTYGNNRGNSPFCPNVPDSVGENPKCFTTCMTGQTTPPSLLVHPPYTYKHTHAHQKEPQPWCRLKSHWDNWGKRNRAVTQPNTKEGNGRLPAQNVLMRTHGWKTCDLFVYLNVHLDITSYVIYLYRFYNIDCCDIILLKCIILKWMVHVVWSNYVLCILNLLASNT